MTFNVFILENDRFTFFWSSPDGGKTGKERADMSNPPTVAQCLVDPNCPNEEAAYCIFDVLQGFSTLEDFAGVIAVFGCGLQGGGKSHIFDRLQEDMPNALPGVEFLCTGGDRILKAINKTYNTPFEEDKEVKELADGLPKWVKPKPKTTVGVAHALAQVQEHDFVCKRSGPRVVATDNTSPTPDSVSGYIAALPADTVKIAVIVQPEFIPDEELYVNELLKIKYDEECNGANQWLVRKALKPAVDALEDKCKSLWDLLHQSDNCDNPVATAYTMLQVLTHTQEWIDYADVSIVVPGHRK